MIDCFVKKRMTNKQYLRSIDIDCPNSNQTKDVIVHILLKSYSIGVSVPKIFATCLHPLSLLVSQHNLHNILVSLLAILFEFGFNSVSYLLARWVQVAWGVLLFGHQLIPKHSLYELPCLWRFEFLSMLGFDLVLARHVGLFLWHSNISFIFHRSNLFKYSVFYIFKNEEKGAAHIINSPTSALRNLQARTPHFQLKIKPRRTGIEPVQPFEHAT